MLKNTGEIATGMDCDYAHFSDGNWYKFSKKNATKEKAIEAVIKKLGIAQQQIIAFGDDYVDIEMLRNSGLGIAMGNAIHKVKEIADDVTKSNDEDVFYPILVRQIHYYKETEGGRATMCKAVEELAEKWVHKPDLYEASRQSCSFRACWINSAGPYLL